MPVDATAGLVAALDLTFPDTSRALRLIVAAGNGTSGASYTLSGLESLQVESISVDVDTTGAALTTQMRADLFDQSGKLLASAQSIATIDPGGTGQVTFSPRLEDTAALTPPVSAVNIQTGLWETVADTLATVTVSASEFGVIVTEVRLWVLDVLDTPGKVSALPPLLAHEPLT